MRTRYFAVLAACVCVAAVGCVESAKLDCTTRSVAACETDGACVIGGGPRGDLALQCLAEPRYFCFDRNPAGAIPEDSHICYASVATGEIVVFANRVPDLEGAGWRPCTEDENAMVQRLPMCVGGTRP